MAPRRIRGCIRQRLLRLRAVDGVSLIEMLVTMSVLLTAGVALAGTLTAAVASHDVARDRTQAQQIARDAIETIRRMPYNNVGLPGGNPSGTVQPTRTVSATGLDATVTTQIAYINDPNPGGYVTAANYKRIVVTVTRNQDGFRLARQVTYVAPPERATLGGLSSAIVSLQVVDYALSAGVPGATVTLSTGPSAPRTDTTDSTGRVTFPSLTPNPVSGSQAYYDLSTSLSGYQTLTDDVSPSAAAHVQLSPGQTFATALRVYRPATIYVALQSSTGTPYTGTSTVTVGSSRGSQSFSVTGGALTITSIAGELVVPGLQYTVSASAPGPLFAPAITKLVPNSYPSDLTSTYTLRFGTYTTGTLNVTVRHLSGSALISGATVVVSGGPAPTYLLGTTNGSGVATFTVPSGTGYAITATSGNERGTGTATVASGGTTNVTVYTAVGG